VAFQMLAMLRSSISGTFAQRFREERLPPQP
jgi:hypothetical protein